MSVSYYVMAALLVVCFLGYVHAIHRERRECAEKGGEFVHSMCLTKASIIK